MEVILHNLTSNQFSELIANAISQGLEKFKSELTPPAEKPLPEEYLSKKQCASILGVSLSTINRRIENGTIKAYGQGGKIFIKKSDLENSLKVISPTK